MSGRRRLRTVAGVLATLCLGFAKDTASAQQIIQLDPEFSCAAQPHDVAGEVYVFNATSAAERVLRELIDYVGLTGHKIQLRAANVKNAIAYLDPVTQDRVILYDESFVRDLQEKSRSAWVPRAILAHELAHHLELHLQTASPDRRRIEELEADRFAGHILFKMDADLDTVRKVFESLKEGDGYPPRSARLAAATNGWWSAKEQTDYDPDRPGASSDDDLGGPAPVPSPVPSTFLAPRSSLGAVVQPRLEVQHVPFVLHSGGLNGGPGLTFQLHGEIEVSNPGLLGVRILFAFPDGRQLFPHPQEQTYFGPGRRLATGALPVPVSAGTVDLRTMTIDPIPHYVLNLVPTGYQSVYPLLVVAEMHLDGGVIATTPPVEITVTW